MNAGKTFSLYVINFFCKTFPKKCCHFAPKNSFREEYLLKKLAGKNYSSWTTTTFSAVKFDAKFGIPKQISLKMQKSFE